MRFLPLAAALPICLLLCTPCLAAAAADPVPDESSIVQMEQRALQAKPHEQCFLYTQLVQDMTIVARHQLLVGDSEHATTTLKRIEHYTHLIHLSLNHDAHRLKEAQLAMNAATHHLAEFLHRLSPEDKAAVQSTLAQLDEVNDELLTQVFAH